MSTLLPIAGTREMRKQALLLAGRHRRAMVVVLLLHAYRAGRTTVVVTTSPLVLDQADVVLLVENGQVAATGRHRELLRESDAYRDVVTRGEAG